MTFFAHSKSVSAQSWRHKDENIYFLPLRNLPCIEEPGVHKQKQPQFSKWDDREFLWVLWILREKATSGRQDREGACVRLSF